MRARLSDRLFPATGAAIGVALVVLIDRVGIAHLSDPLGIPALLIFAIVGALLGHLFSAFRSSTC